MKLFNPIFFILLLGMSSHHVLAQGREANFPVGSIIRGFTISEPGPDGKIRYRITGREATVMGPNRIKISQLRIVFYRDFPTQDIETEITSKESDYFTNERKLSTVHGVKIRRDNLTIEADEMDWILGQDEGSLRKNVRVVITGELIPQPERNNTDAS